MVRVKSSKEEEPAAQWGDLKRNKKFRYKKPLSNCDQSEIRMHSWNKVFFGLFWMTNKNNGLIRILILGEIMQFKKY